MIHPAPRSQQLRRGLARCLRPPLGYSRAEAAEARAVVGAGAGASGSQAEAAGGAGTTAGGSDSEAEFDGDTGAMACWGAVGGAGAMLAVETLRASWDSGRTFRTGVDPSEVSGVELVPVRGGAN